MRPETDNDNDPKAALEQKAKTEARWQQWQVGYAIKRDREFLRIIQARIKRILSSR